MPEYKSSKETTGEKWKTEHGTSKRVLICYVKRQKLLLFLSSPIGQLHLE